MLLPLLPYEDGDRVPFPPDWTPLSLITKAGSVFSHDWSLFETLDPFPLLKHEGTVLHDTVPFLVFLEAKVLLTF